MDKANVKTVVLIDDYPLFRKAMADVLNATDRFTVLAQTGDQTVARGLAVLQPDLIVMALSMERFDTLGFLKEIRSHNTKSRIVMMMDSPEQSALLMQAIRLDANGYLLRSVSVPEFTEQLIHACSGGMASSEKVTSALAERLRGEQAGQEEGRASDVLTRREYDVLCCIASGLTNRDISQRLNITDGTVKVHVKHVLKKLNFRSRVEVAVWASERGYKLPANQDAGRDDGTSDD
ncbi:MAG: LuxR C-terminal-related transcriptional regulator [Sutterella sp.]|nr:LuxR C-terminal-related transcriptional regulator [Sutterella sp.]